MAVIQKREEEKREEKRRKEMAKQVVGPHCTFKHSNSALMCSHFYSRWHSQERLETMEQPLPANPSLLGKSPPSPKAGPPDIIEAKKAVANRRRTTSSTRHRYTAPTAHVKSINKNQCKAKEMNLPPADVTRLMKRTVDLRRSFILTAPLTESCSSTKENV